MISHLRGQVTARGGATGTAWVVVDVHGVGYLVHVAGTDRLPARGEPVELHTSLQVREDAMTLYGFVDRSALELFELLLGSSGVGPKLALAALATHRPDTLRAALSTADVTTLTAVPGIGKKVAQRLVLELRERVGGVAADGVEPATSSPGATTPLGEAREALLALGYTAGEVSDALASVDGDGADVSVLVRAALARLGRATVGGAR